MFIIFYNFCYFFILFVNFYKFCQKSWKIMIFTPRKFRKIKKILGLEVQRTLLRKCAQVAELDFFGAFPQTLWPSPCVQDRIRLLLAVFLCVSHTKNHKKEP